MATLNPQIPLEARQTVLDQIVAGASFTAYEITLEVRRRLGPTVEVPHGVVNTIVQTMFGNGEMAGYDRAPDTSVKAATPPFRYAPRAARGAVALAPTPAFVGVNRGNLPINLRYSNPIAAIIRAYSVEARAFHDAAGVGDKPFKVGLPTAQTPTLRIRSVGAVPGENEVLSRYSLSPASHSDFGSKAAFAYADEFRITTFQSGTAKTYRAALDMNLVGTVTKDGEVKSKQEDGVEIEVAVKPGDVQRFCDEAAIVFAYFRVPPRVQGGLLGAFNRPKPVLKGTGWKITSGGGSLAVVGDVAFTINNFNFSFLPRNAPLNLELDFAPGELAVSETGETLAYTGTTRLALIKAFQKVESDSVPQIAQRIGAEPDIWRAKIRFGQLASSLGLSFQNSSQKIEWQGIPLDSHQFTVINPNEVAIRFTSRTSFGTGLQTRRISQVSAQLDTVVIFNDLGTRTGSPARLREYFSSNPTIQSAYVLTFASDAAKERFIADNHFETVPTFLLSSLPKPASTSSHTARPLNRVPFDASKHAVRPPRASLLASFPNLNDAAYADLEKWVRDSRFDGKQWPDFKRLYKKAEARLWPIQNRFRWNKTEADLPVGTPVPDEREAFLLGVLIGHLDSAGTHRGDSHQFPNGGPNARTVAYMVRRAVRLLRFLQDGQGLSEARRALLAPLVAGSMVRAYCADTQATLAFNLGIQNDALQGRPDLVQRIWNDNSLAVPILRWAFEWLRSNGEAIEGTPRHIRRFIEAGDEDAALALLPAVLESGVRWADGYPLTDLARDLQTFAQRGGALRLFARFPQITATERWIWGVLGTPEAEEPEVVRFATPLVQARAQNGEWETVTQLGPALRAVFLAALVAARPQGMRLKQWHAITNRGSLLLNLLFPALIQMQMSPEVAKFLWEASAVREEWLRLGGETKWVEAFASTIREWARAENFDSASQLPPSGRTLFFQEFAATRGDALWAKLGELAQDTLTLFSSDIATLTLSEGFWTFASDLDTQNSANWLDMVGRQRATADFTRLTPPTIRALLDSKGSGLEDLIAAWLRGNVEKLLGEEPLLMLAAINLNEGVRAPALARLRQVALPLRVALLLVESGLPEAQDLARPYFEQEGNEWAMRALALADSPVAATRAYALDLLSRFSSRWTPELLRSLAQHDDARVQAFVAAHLQRAPEVAASEAVIVFDSAIINSRGRARRAKAGVQRRLETSGNEEQAQLDSLLDAARNGAPRDRAWALQQLVRLQLSGADIPELHLAGAVARSTS